MTVRTDTLLVNQPKDRGECNDEQRSGFALVRKYEESKTLLEVQKLCADVQINGESLRVLKCFLHRMCLPAQGLAND